MKLLQISNMMNVLTHPFLPVIFKKWIGIASTETKRSVIDKFNQSWVTTKRQWGWEVLNQKRVHFDIMNIILRSLREKLTNSGKWDNVEVRRRAKMFSTKPCYYHLTIENCWQFMKVILKYCNNAFDKRLPRDQNNLNLQKILILQMLDEHLPVGFRQ